jgi:hypothetical protein
VIALPNVRAPLGLLLVTAASILALTACGPIKAGSAATVGDESLAESTVATTSEEVDAVIADAGATAALPPDQVNQRIVAQWVDGQIVGALAAAQDVAVTDGDIDRFLEQFDEKARVDITSQAAIPPSQLDFAARTALLRNELAKKLAPDGTADEQSVALNKALVLTAKGLGVSVNPRFGTWNPTIPGVEARSADRLSTPVKSDAPVNPLAPGTP